ncbi:MAG: 4Fe-4S dicluster domain-containing protein [Candidatus Omnitrophica bacterium]|nr:4Fe-4S dicluster domain-containing protein [Candidatus Omnitrophota bacterium]
MRYPKLRELKEAIKALIKGPYTSDYPRKPHKAYERFRGRPYFHQDDCVGCTACAQVCPVKAIDYEDGVINGKGRRKLIVHWDICIFCGQCQANCITEKGIMLSQEYDFATTENREALNQEIEKELALCDCCGETIVPFDQYAWVAEKIGPLSFSNPALFLFYLRILDLALQDQPQRKQDLELRRSDRIKILCPRCRREAAIKS